MPQRLSLVTLLVRDYDEALAWYRDRAGLRARRGHRPRRRHPLGRRPPGRLRRHPGAAGPGEHPRAVSRVGDPGGGRVMHFLATDDFAGRPRADGRGGGAVPRGAAARALRRRGRLRGPLRQRLGPHPAPLTSPPAPAPADDGLRRPPRLARPARSQATRVAPSHHCPTRSLHVRRPPRRAHDPSPPPRTVVSLNSAGRPARSSNGTRPLPPVSGPPPAARLLGARWPVRDHHACSVVRPTLVVTPRRAAMTQAPTPTLADRPGCRRDARIRLPCLLARRPTPLRSPVAPGRS